MVVKLKSYANHQPAPNGLPLYLQPATIPRKPVTQRITMTENLSTLKTRIRQFAEERDWDQFHSPKNLSMALIAEAAELVEHFQWLTEKESSTLPPEKLQEVEAELADIFIYLLRIADKLGVDLMQAADTKISLNEQKYPADKVRGSAKKYTEYE
jgi:NTP pyrophosphatase (non-canonical NTP hydrolase)